MAKAFDVAAYIVKWFADQFKEDNDLTQLKLQKLLYYCQGHYLAWKKKPLFPEPLQAWDHGPVVPTVYSAYANTLGQGIYVIRESINGDPNALNSEEQDFIDQVLLVRGQYSPWRLREMTHNEAPWCDHYEETKRNEIPHESMINYFKTFVK